MRRKLQRLTRARAMTDCFAQLDEPRRPWLDAEALKEKFLALSTATHPDRFHTASAADKEAASRHYAELNAAHARLREPKDRLAHLLELEQGCSAANIQSVPDDATELFFHVGQLCRAVDQFLAGRAQVTSPLLKVQSFERGLALTDQISQLQRTLQQRHGALDAELKSLNPAWLAAPPASSPGRAAQLPLARVEQIYRALSFTARWRAQLQERFVQLSL